MEVSNNFSRYDSTIQSQNLKVQQNQQVNRTGRIKEFFEAFRVDLSPRAKASKEFNDPNIKFPTHNPEVLQYSEKLNLVFKP